MMTRWRFRPRWLALAGGVAALLAALAWAAVPSSPSPAPLAAMLPAGALMTVESADFGALVAAWNASPEQRAWLSSANYSAFANSRLFTRLADAQSGFADAASTGIDGNFLREIAGKESIFAWYNIGNLEFLYVSRLPGDRLAKLSLLAQRGSFARREVAGTAFFVRTSAGGGGSGAGGASGTSDPQDTPDASEVDQPRTVAFAVRGDWLLLATREDLIAGALQLMAAPQSTRTSSDSQATAGWYAAANAAAPAHPGDLHMLLDLQALTRTPQFRTYWIQRNVTALRQYRAAVVDLYREPGQFREERVLLPMQTAAASNDQPDLGTMEQLVPERAGVYRAVAHPATAEVLDALRDKVLVREPTTATANTSSPAAQTAVTPVGEAGDFDTHIDTPPAKEADARAQWGDLRRALDATGLDSMLTVDRSDPPSKSDAFVHISSAVVLRSASPWNKDALPAALLAGLRPRLTSGSLGLAWMSSAGGSLPLGETDPICLSVEGRLAILTSDPAMMADILKLQVAAKPPALPATIVAGFRHDAERPNFRRLTAALNQVQTDAAAPGVNAASSQAPTAVDLFRDNLPSLSDSFQAMSSEHFIETGDGAKVHQTVLYRWSAASAPR